MFKRAVKWLFGWSSSNSNTNGTGNVPGVSGMVNNNTGPDGSYQGLGVGARTDPNAPLVVPTALVPVAPTANQVVQQQVGPQQQPLGGQGGHQQPLGGQGNGPAQSVADVIASLSSEEYGERFEGWLVNQATIATESRHPDALIRRMDVRRGRGDRVVARLIKRHIDEVAEGEAAGILRDAGYRVARDQLVEQVRASAAVETALAELAGKDSEAMRIGFDRTATAVLNISSSDPIDQRIEEALGDRSGGYFPPFSLLTLDGREALLMVMTEHIPKIVTVSEGTFYEMPRAKDDLNARVQSLTIYEIARQFNPRGRANGIDRQATMKDSRIDAVLADSFVGFLNERKTQAHPHGRDSGDDLIKVKDGRKLTQVILVWFIVLLWRNMTGRTGDLPPWLADRIEVH
eukprot:CAMPEP_0113505196 /NCGR_PEP_ID=MMETSP0014_2-20120614/35173_1 /TAXON_ID=2857 /ORGANISM="Nitzschia sp." /LENGTH=402 /DNA_ID=CAMNT_0000400463 /DNA_START=423 /DNA_END=1631 /DNA_ORIENTATION=+ /assembly_acc=CAM_ASM_000159